MRILSIETSCDETALALVRTKGTGNALTFEVEKNALSSQTAIHAPYGGVFPMLAKREHAKALPPLLRQIFPEVKKGATLPSRTTSWMKKLLAHEGDAFIDALTLFLETTAKPKLDRIAVTSGPGLEPALWVGINCAKALAKAWDVPLVPVNHMEGHALSPLLSAATASKMKLMRFPALALLVSGGHTELVLMKKGFSYQVVGETRDDAAGEAFDKVARMLELPYPGGPEVSRLAKTGTPGRYPLPRPMLTSDDFDFSFAGLKTAVLYTLKKIEKPSQQDKADIAREFEDAVVDVLAGKTLRAAQEFGATTIVLGGGVSANTALRERLARDVREKLPGAVLHLPDAALTTDNAVMIAAAGLFGRARPLASVRAEGNARL